MLASALHRAGVRRWMLHTLSFSSMALRLLLWQRAETVDQDQRDNAERRALSIGVWR